ncbi:hypothetical protein niasHS_015744 [Heterodera schachtii]|uniref:DDE-1 domain-containing protein n=1 Tax=Heterodera schachtii TaxID=97005 RepID=A0ABD2HTC4_HETSC
MDAVKTVPESSFVATATILVLVRTNAGSAQNLAMRLHHAHLHMTPKRDSAQKSHAVCAGSTLTLTKAQVPPFQQNQSATKTTKHCHSSSLNKLLRTTTTTSTTLQKNTCSVMVWQNMDGQRLDDGVLGKHFRKFPFRRPSFGVGQFPLPHQRGHKENASSLRPSLCGHPGYFRAPDVCWNAPFKEAIRKLYNDWMAHGEKATTSGGNLKAPPMEVYLEWIANAWDSLQKQMIADSFLTCGISKEEKGRHDDKTHVFKPDGAIPNGLALLKQHRQEEEVLKMVEESI